MMTAIPGLEYFFVFKALRVNPILPVESEDLKSWGNTGILEYLSPATTFIENFRTL
ncbi:MAG: hypothetical protein ACKV2V_18060 [Blastocatellia bacterium]